MTGARIKCPSDCSEALAQNTMVKLAATITGTYRVAIFPLNLIIHLLKDLRFMPHCTSALSPCVKIIKCSSP